MAFAQGSVSSFADLAAEILAFLTANGWTQEGSSVVKKNGVYASVTSATDYIEMIGAKGSDGAGNLVEIFDRLADSYILDSPVGCRMTRELQWYDSSSNFETVTMGFPINYNFHLSASPVDEFYCFIEYNGGYCQHLAFGNIVKECPFTGGGFFTATCGSGAGSRGTFKNLSVTNISGVFTPNMVATPFLPSHYAQTSNGKNAFTGSAVHAEISGVDWWFSTKLEGFEGMYPSTSRILHLPSQPMEEERGRAQSPVNGITSLIPFRLFGTLPNGNLHRIGHLSGIRFALIDNISFGQIETDGTDSWKFYPTLFKNSGDPLHTTGMHSGNHGIAVKYDGP